MADYKYLLEMIKGQKEDGCIVDYLMFEVLVLFGTAID
jgi:hypothetical protein